MPRRGPPPLDPNEAEGLLLTHITTRAELDRWEQENIAEAEAWAFRRAHSDILPDGFARRLHKRMFGNVWRWAGLYRKTGKNIGISAWKIAAELRKLCDDCKTWIEYGSYSPDEIAARFHHRRRQLSRQLLPARRGDAEYLAIQDTLRGVPRAIWHRCRKAGGLCTYHLNSGTVIFLFLLLSVCYKML